MPPDTMPKYPPPDLSVVIPLYNAQEYVGQAIESVLSQGGNNCEIIIIDDASDDGSRSVATQYSKHDNRVRLLCLPENIGPGPSRNIGIKSARGRYVRFLDADDYYPADSLMRFLLFAENNGADIAAGNILSSDAMEGSTYPKDASTWIQQEGCSHLSNNPAFWVPLHHHRYIYRRDFLAANSIDYPSLRRGQDPVMLAKALLNTTQIYHVPDPVYVHRTFSRRGLSDFVALKDIVKHFSLVLDLYGDHGYRYLGCLHLFNRINLLCRMGVYNLNSDQRIEIMDNISALFSKIQWADLKQNYSPYDVRLARKVLIGFILASVKLVRRPEPSRLLLLAFFRILRHIRRYARAIS